MRRMARVALAAALFGASAHALSAQTATLTVTGAATQMPSPTLADYVAGSLTDPTPVTYSLRLNSGRANCTYTIRVQLRASGADLGSGKPISDLQWSTTGSYTSVTASYVTVATHTMSTAATTASGSITLRVRLNWTDTAASYTGSALGFRTSGTASGSGC
ncbi:MAG: hypothetical protein P3B98_11655 [Gemmatimonadota bacterium]|nr:hypothetical protein [Gemmatimonadota bacterium]